MDEIKIDTLSTRTLLERGREEKLEFMKFTTSDLKKSFSGSFTRFSSPVIDICNLFINLLKAQKFEDFHNDDFKLKQESKKTTNPLPILKDTIKNFNDATGVDINVAVNKLSFIDLKTYCESLKQACK